MARYFLFSVPQLEKFDYRVDLPIVATDAPAEEPQITFEMTPSADADGNLPFPQARFTLTTTAFATLCVGLIFPLPFFSLSRVLSLFSRYSVSSFFTLLHRLVSAYTQKWRRQPKQWSRSRQLLHRRAARRNDDQNTVHVAFSNF